VFTQSLNIAMINRYHVGVYASDKVSSGKLVNPKTNHPRVTPRFPFEEYQNIPKPRPPNRFIVGIM
jgi:hypothetical protein